MKNMISPIAKLKINNNEDLKPSDMAVETEANTSGPGAADIIIIPNRDDTIVLTAFYDVDKIHPVLGG